MTPLLEALRAIARDLDREGARWALVGGLAVSARTEPRFTRDLDVAVAVPDDGAAEPEPAYSYSARSTDSTTSCRLARAIPLSTQVDSGLERGSPEPWRMARSWRVPRLT